MKKSLWFFLFLVWFGLLLGGVAKASEVPEMLTEQTVASSSPNEISCQEFHYFRESCGELVKLLTQDALSQMKAISVSGNTAALK